MFLPIFLKSFDSYFDVSEIEFTPIQGNVEDKMEKDQSGQ
jgi:hypothetical protein